MKPADRKFIQQVAADKGIRNLTEEQIRRAHKYARGGAKQDYYYRLKDYFAN